MQNVICEKKNKCKQFKTSTNYSFYEQFIPVSVNDKIYNGLYGEHSSNFVSVI